MKSLIQTEIAYSEWANRRLLDVCAGLTPEELEHDFGASHRSVVGTLQHILYGERAWTLRLVKHELPPFDLLGDPRSDPGPPLDLRLETLQRHWPLVWSSVNGWIDAISEERLAAELPSLRTDGSSFVTMPWQVALHMVNHSTLHRGQIISMIRSLGKQPPNLDLFTFYWAERSGDNSS